MEPDRLIYISTESYLKEWLVHNFGDPCRVLSGTPQSALLRQYLCRVPSDAVPYDGDTAFLLPKFKAHPFSDFSYLPPSARRLLVRSYTDLFCYSLFRDVVKMEMRGFLIQDLLYAYLEKNSMDVTHYDVVRQVYYRIRQTYHRHSNLNI